MASKVRGIRTGQLGQAQAVLREAGSQLRQHSANCLTCRQISQGAEILCQQAAEIEMDIKQASKLVRSLRNPEIPGEQTLF